MHAPAADLAAKYAVEIAEWLPDSNDRAALTVVVARTIWCGDDLAGGLAGALLGVVESVAVAVHDAIAHGECKTDRFRRWIGPSLEALAEQIAAVERNITIVAPGTGHA
jgi:hypothetical protein